MIAYNKNYLNLLREIVITHFKEKEQSTFFGFVWSFLNPLLMLAVLFIFFKIRIGDEIEHYAIYLLIGIIQYTHFSNSTSISMPILRSMKNLTCNTIFPKEILVLGVSISNMIEFILSMLICVMIAFFSGINLSLTLIMLLCVFVLQLMLVLWISLILSCMYVFIKDIDHIYKVFLRVLLFITPIFYDISFVGNGVGKYIVLLNPLTYLIRFSREIVIEGKPLSFDVFLLFLFINTFLLFTAFKIFKKLEPKFAENV